MLYNIKTHVLTCKIWFWFVDLVLVCEDLDFNSHIGKDKKDTFVDMFFYLIVGTSHLNTSLCC